MSELVAKYSLEYLAGFFDGEGCISTDVVGGHDYPKIRVSQLAEHREVIDAFAARWGGYVYEPQSYLRYQRRPMVTWGSHSRSGENTLRDLLPHLKQKRPQAELALEMMALTPPCRRDARGQWTHDPRARSLRKHLAVAIRGLNQGTTEVG